MQRVTGSGSGQQRIKVALSSLGWHLQHRLTPRAQALRCAREKAVVGSALALLAGQLICREGGVRLMPGTEARAPDDGR